MCVHAFLWERALLLNSCVWCPGFYLRSHTGAVQTRAYLFVWPQIREHMKNESVRGQSNQASTDMFQ